MAQSFREARANTGTSGWIKVPDNYLSPDSSEPPPPPPLKLCINCKYVEKRKDDYDFMCRNLDVAGLSLVTGTPFNTLAWQARSDGGKCGKSAKFYESVNPPAKVEAANPGGQAQVPVEVDATPPNPDVLPPV